LVEHLVYTKFSVTKTTVFCGFYAKTDANIARTKRKRLTIF
jgi:hypothetical protein